MNNKKILKGIDKRIESSKLSKIANFLGLKDFNLENNIGALKEILKSKKMLKN